MTFELGVRDRIHHVACLAAETLDPSPYASLMTRTTSGTLGSSATNSAIVSSQVSSSILARGPLLSATG